MFHTMALAWAFPRVEGCSKFLCMELEEIEEMELEAKVIKETRLHGAEAKGNEKNKTNKTNKKNVMSLGFLLAEL